MSETRPAGTASESVTATTPSDEDVVERVRAGDVELFEVLMRRYNQRVYRAARAVLRDDHEAEEAMQEAWVRAYTKLASFAGRARFSTWLTRIVLNHAIERDRLRRRTIDPAAARGATTEAARSAEQQALDEELRRALERAVGELPEVFRTTLVLRAVEGLSTAETAECQEISEETVRTRLHRARELLRHDIEERFGARLRDCFTFGAERCDRVVAAVLAHARANVARER
ncbi:MAG: RNA polymerase sigma factor [Thermodesulfobacteriota bacterium]